MILGPLGLVGRANHPAQWGRMGDEDCTKEADCMHGVRLCHLPVCIMKNQPLLGCRSSHDLNCGGE